MWLTSQPYPCVRRNDKKRGKRKLSTRRQGLEHEGYLIFLSLFFLEKEKKKKKTKQHNKVFIKKK